MTKKIYMLPSWTGSSDHMRRLFIRQTPNSSGIWGNTEVTDNIDKADFHIQMDKPKNGLIDPSKTIYMNWEPPNKGGYYLCEDYNVAGKILFQNNHFPCIWFLDYTYDELKKLKPIKKTKKMSSVVSNKKRCHGHHIRHRFTKHICEKYPNDIQLYGSVSKLPEFKNINIEEANDLTKLGRRGNFFDKSKTLLPYKYHLCMENTSINNYFTEKITDSLLMWSLPIYWGCTNILEFLPEGSFIPFDGLDLKEVNKIKRIIDIEDVYIGSLDKINSSRDLILNKYNFCNVIDKFINW